VLSPYDATGGSIIDRHTTFIVHPATYHWFLAEAIAEWGMCEVRERQRPVELLQVIAVASNAAAAVEDAISRRCTRRGNICLP
jgi:hypothetical protein